MKKLAVILIIIGVMVASYPLLEQLFAWYWQHKLMSAWEEPRDARTGDFKQLDILQGDGNEEENEQSIPLTPQGEVLGILSIDSIKLKLPVIQGLNATNLKIGVSYLEDTPLFGENGNTVLAGHRGHSYGRLLNRLNEVQLQDSIVVSTKQGDYEYHVFNKVIVKPEETELLRSAGNEKILTIVTCEPIRKPTHRLIVQAKLD